MDDELRKIEVETARLRLERERLAYEEQFDKQNRNRLVNAATEQVIDATKNVGSVALWASISLLRIAFGFLLGAAGCAIAIAFIFIVDPKITNFGFHYGYWMGRGGWVLILFGGIISGALFVFQAKKSRTQDYLFGSHWPSEFWRNFNTYACFVGGVITMIVGYRTGDVTVMIFGCIGFLFGFIMPYLKEPPQESKKKSFVSEKGADHATIVGIQRYSAQNLTQLLGNFGFGFLFIGTLANVGLFSVLIMFNVPSQYHDQPWWIISIYLVVSCITGYLWRNHGRR